MAKERPPLSTGRRVARGVLFAAVLLATGVATAPLTVRGRTVGALIERLLPPMRGSVHVGGARWTYGALVGLALGRATVVELQDVRIDDPAGEEVLRAGRVVGRVELARGQRRAVVRDLVLEHVSGQFIDAGGGRGVGLVEALRPPVSRPGPSATAGAPFAFSIVDARVADLSARFAFRSWGLTLDAVTIESASLSFVTGRGGSFTFEVHGATSGQGGDVRIGGGTRAWTLPFQKARIDRLATTSAAPEVIHLEASEIAWGKSRSAVRGDFRGVYGVSKPRLPEGLTLEVTAVHAAEIVEKFVEQTLGQVAAHHGLGTALVLGGAEATASAQIAGPYNDVRLSLQVDALTLGRSGLQLSPVSFRLDVAPRAGEYRASNIRIGWRDVGTFTGALALDVRGGVVSVRDVDVALARPPGASPPRLIDLRKRGPAGRQGPSRGATALQVSEVKFANGALRTRHLMLPVWGGALDVSGELTWRDKAAGNLTTPVLDASLVGRGLVLDHLLGSRFVRGTLDFRAQLRGPVTALRCQVIFPAAAGVTILGERLALPRRLRFAYAEGGTYVHVDLTGGRGAKVQVAGRIEGMRRADVKVEINDFPSARLPGLAETGLAFDGPMSGRLRVAGDLDALVLSGKLEIHPVLFRGRNVGTGKLEITTESSGALRVRGQVMNGVGLDGWLRTDGRGARGEARLTLDNVEMDPFGMEIPLGLGVRGTASGVLVARVAPGRPSSIEGRLSALTLLLTPLRAPRGRPPRPLELRAQSAIDVSARTDGTVSLGPAHFAGAGGDFVVALQGRGVGAKGSVRGRVELAPFATFLSRAVEAPAGTVAVELTASRQEEGGPMALTGDAVVRAPVSFRIAGEPVEVRIPAGRVRATGDAIEANDLPVTFVATPKASLPLTRAAGSARVDARLTAVASGAWLRARVVVGHVELAVPLLGSAPVVIDGGHFSFAGAPDTLVHLPITDVDVPLRGTATQAITPVGTIERALFDLRLRGASRRALTLSGDIEVVAVRLPAAQLAAAAAPPAGAARPAKEVDLENPRLDLRLHSRRGAVTVEIDHVPDVHLDVDLHVGGTLARPALSGQAQPVGIYSTIVLALKRIFD